MGKFTNVVVNSRVPFDESTIRPPRRKRGIIPLHVGQRQGRLVAAGPVFIMDVRGETRSFLVCKCDCGNYVLTMKPSFVAKSTASCGCLRKERGRKMLTTERAQSYGRHPLYNRWNQMVRRCTDPSNHAFDYYGGRGIWVHGRWIKSAKAFIQFCEDNGWKPGLTLERIDNDFGYTPSNLAFKTPTEQARNRRSTKYLIAFGETKPAAEWAEDPRCHVNYNLLMQRVRKYGWDVERALTEPRKTRRSYATGSKR